MMAAFKLDGNKNKRCAFCKYWYDLTNQYIKPLKNQRRNTLWQN